MPAGRTQRLPVGLCRRHGRAAGLGVSTRVASHNCPHPSFTHDRAIGTAVGHAGRPDPATTRRSVPSAWPGSWAGSADSSGLTQLSTSIFHFPVETGEFDARPGYRDDRRTCRPAGPRDCPSVCPVGMAGQLGWECRLEWADTTVHIHLSVPSRDWRVRCTIGLSGWPSDMPAGRTQRLPVVEGPPAGVDVGSLRVRVS